MRRASIDSVMRTATYCLIVAALGGCLYVAVSLYLAVMGYFMSSETKPRQWTHISVCRRNGALEPRVHDMKTGEVFTMLPERAWDLHHRLNYGEVP